MGAWIEIIGAWHLQNIHSVAPFMGAWIEILLRYNSHNAHMRRSLHGSVD